MPRISALPVANSVGSSDLVVIVQGNTTKRASAGQIVANGNTNANFANLTVNGILTVTGNANLQANATVGGNLTVSGNGNTVGSQTVGGSLTVSGDSTLSGNANISGNEIVTGTHTVTGNINACANIVVTGNVNINSQIVGGYSPVTFNSSDFTGSGSMSWTVASGNVTNFSYEITNKKMTVALAINATSIGGTPSNTLQVKIPSGKIAARDTYGSLGTLIDSGNRTTGFLAVNSGGNQILINRTDIATFLPATANTTVRGQITFEIN